MTFAVRPATLNDAGRIAAIYAPIVETTHISFEEVAPTEAEMRARIESAQSRMPWLVADAGDVIAYSYASEHRVRAAYRWSVDVALYVTAHARRSGAGRALYTALFAILKRQGFYNAFAGIALPNDASIGFHRTLGFEPVGVYRNVGYKLGRWCDVSWWQRPLAAPHRHPPEPLPLTGRPASAGTVHGCRHPYR